MFGNCTSHCGRFVDVMDFASENSTSAVRNRASVASVMMMAGTRAKATSNPLMTPNPAPTRIANRTSSAGLSSGYFVTRLPAANAVKPTIDPTDRSMLRVRMTMVWPVAMSAMIATELEVRLKSRPFR